MAETNLDIIIRAKNEAQAVIKKLQADIQKVKKELTDSDADTFASEIDDISKSMKRVRNEAEKAGTSTKKIGSEAKKARPLFERLKQSAKGLAKNIKDSEAQIQKVTATLTKFAAVGTVALVGTVVAAASFEAGLTNVAKTTGLAGAELNQLGEEIDALSRKIPVSTAGLNDIATIAGQLGINSAADIIKFTETVANLSVVSDFTAGAAAEALARLSNVFLLPIDNVDRLASVINELENNTTATAPILANFAQRLAVAGKATNVSIEEILGLSATLIDLGFRAEEAGTSVSKILIEMSSNAEKFAKLTGLSVDEFRGKFEEDAVGAFTLVAQAISELDAAEASEQFEELGLNGIRVRNVMTALSSRLDLLGKNIKIASDEFEENTSLQKELAVFIQSTSNQFKLLQNVLLSVARVFGTVLLPPVRFVIESIRLLSEAFLALPSFIKTTIVIFTVLGVALVSLVALLGALALASGGVTAALGFLSGQLTILQARLATATVVGTGFAASLKRIGLAALTAAANTTLFQLAVGLLVGGLVAVAAALVIAIIKIAEMNAELDGIDSQIGAFQANVISTARAAREGARTIPKLTEAVKNVGTATKEANIQLLKELELRRSAVAAEINLQKALIDRTKAINEVPTIDQTQQLAAQESQLKKNEKREKSLADQIEAVTKQFDVSTKAVKINTAALEEQERQFELLTAGTDRFFKDLQSLNDIKFAGLIAELTSATEIRKTLLEAGDASAEVLAAAEIDATQRIIDIKTREVQERLALENRRIDAQASLIEKNISNEVEAAEALNALAQQSVSNQIKATADLISIRQKAVDDVKAQLAELVTSAKASRDEIEGFIREAEAQLLQGQNALLPVAQQTQKAQTDVVAQQEAIRNAIREGNVEKAREGIKTLITLEKEAAKVRKDAAGFVTEDTAATQARSNQNTQTRIDLLKSLQVTEQSQATSEQTNLKVTLEEQEKQLTSLRAQLEGLGTLSGKINLETNFGAVVDNLDALQTRIKSLAGPDAPIKVDLDVSADVIKFFEGSRVISIPIEGLDVLNTVGDAFVAKINVAATQLEAVARALAITQQFNQQSGNIGFAEGGAVDFADGGKVVGPGTSTSDSIPARLSTGEFVMREAAVSKFGVGFFDKLNKLRLPGFAKGGAVGAIPKSAASSKDEVNISLNLNKRTFNLRSDRDTALSLVRAFKQLETGLVGQ